MRLSVRWIGDAEQRLDHVARQQRDRQPADRIVLRHELGLERQPVPAAGEKHAEFARRGRAHRLVGRRRP